MELQKDKFYVAVWKGEEKIGKLRYLPKPYDMYDMYWIKNKKLKLQTYSKKDCKEIVRLYKEKNPGTFCTVARYLNPIRLYCTDLDSWGFYLEDIIREATPKEVIAAYRKEIKKLQEK